MATLLPQPLWLVVPVTPTLRLPPMLTVGLKVDGSPQRLPCLAGADYARGAARNASQWARNSGKNSAKSAATAS